MRDQHRKRVDSPMQGNSNILDNSVNRRGPAGLPSSRAFVVLHHGEETNRLLWQALYLLSCVVSSIARSSLEGLGRASLTVVRSNRIRATMKSYHVVPHKDGGWAVRRSGSSRVLSRHPTQAEAISRGREISRNQMAELFIHQRNGRIRDRDSHGNDPFPPRG